ncbi:hypothetical protein [Actinomyces sp.]
MHLEGHHEDGGWLLSTFTLTNRVSWEMMLQAVYAAFEYFADITIFVDDQSVKLESRADVLSIPEARSIGIAGESVVVKEPMIIIFYNQVHFINLRIRCGNDDLRDLDYEGFNKIVCPIVDAIELAMYQEPVPAPVKDDATEETEDGEEEKASGDSEPKDATAESAQEDQAAEASSAEPPIPPPPATEPQDSATPTDAPEPGSEPPIPLPPAEASAPPIPSPAPAPRKRSEFRCN